MWRLAGTLTLLVTVCISALAWAGVALALPWKVPVGMAIIELCHVAAVLLVVFPTVYRETAADQDVERARSLIRQHHSFFAVLQVAAAVVMGVWLGMHVPTSLDYFIAYCLYQLFLTSCNSSPDWRFPIAAILTCGFTIALVALLARG